MNKTLVQFIPAFILKRVHGRPNLQKMISNTGWLFLHKILAITIGLFIGVWVIRYLGPQQFGLYSYAIAFVALFAPLSTLGLRGIVIRNIVRDPSQKYEILGTALLLRLAGGLAVFILSLVIVSQLRSGEKLVYWLVGILGMRVVFQAFFAIDSWFQSQVQSKYTVWATAAAMIIVALVKIVLILRQAPLIVFAWTMLIEVVLGAIGLVILYYITGQKFKAWRGSFIQAKRLLADSWPLLFSAIAVTIYMKIDQVMIGNMIGDRPLGLYSAAVRLSTMWYFIPVAISSSVFPSIVRSYENHDTPEYDKRVQSFYDVMTGVGYVIMIPLVILASWLVNILFGTEYSQAGPILRVHAWSLLFVFMGASYSKALMAQNLVRFHLFNTILGAVVNIGLNLWLIPKYAGLGAAWATVVAYAISGYLACAVSPRLWPMFRQLTISLLVPLRIPSLRRSLREVH